ncbi:MAG: polysaccharide deacetylase family protein [Mobilicoccus sp.]|nr:polysaccharide deacetylase family protein [Mobilicoccus sp.]
MRRAVVAAVVVCVGVIALAALGGYRLMNSRTVQIAGELTARVETDARVVALTLDDGPTCADLDRVLDSVAGVRATFYVNGGEMARCPEAAPRLLAAGHELGNHTWSHRAMVAVSPAIVEDEVASTDAALREAGVEGEITFRPPFGKKLVVLPWWLERHDRHTIMWDVAVETWGDEPQTSGDVVASTVEQVRPGSIVLLHPWGGRTEVQQALPLIIDDLTDQGYEFVTVSELLSLR